MSEETENRSNTTTDAGTSDAEVKAAVEALVQSVEADGAVLPSRAKPKAPKARAGRRSSDDTIDTLVNTVNQLAGSVTTLAGTVESLGDKVQTTVVVAEPVAQSVLAEMEEEEATSGSPLVGLLLGYVGSILAFLSVGAIGWAVMSSPFGGKAVAALVLGCLAFAGVMSFQDRSPQNELKEVMISAVAAALLAFGLGALIGGILFFGDAPARAAVLVPLGVLASAVGFVMRSPHKVSREHMLWLAGAGVWVCLGLFMGLSAMVPKDPSATPVVSTQDSHGAPAHDAHAAAPAAADAHAAAPAAEAHAPAADAHPAPDAHAATPAVDQHAAPAPVVEAYSASDAARVAEAVLAADAAAASDH